jgi:alkanesulfonate monooxygenase SsuD/methylene tetrahydromethanopterin reductase-like flavin-dependent oxidoreductase (luciferase family)
LHRIRETVGVLRSMLAGERVTFEGRTIRTRGFRLVSPPPKPVPIYLAALMPPMLELAGEIADGIILNFMPVEAVPRMLEHVRRGAERAGRDASQLEIVSRFQTIVTDDVAAARARNLPAVTDEMIDRIAVIGPAAHCRARLRAFAEAGVTTPMVHPFLFDEASIWAAFEQLAPA